jgi:hypothetical protein
MNKTTNQGTVIKITEKHIVVLCANGLFKNIPRKHHEVPMMGETIQITDEKNNRQFFHSMWKKSAALASAIIILLISFSLMQAENSNFQPSYVLAIDINPSIELHMDKELRVQQMKALNEDGKIVIEAMDYADKPLLNIIEEMMNQSVELGYLTKAEDGLITATIVTNERTEQKIATDIRSTINHHLNTHQIQANVTISQESMEIIKDAQQLDVSVNKYVIYDRMNRQGFNIPIEEIKTKSIASLLQMESAEKNKKASPPEKLELKELKELKEPMEIKSNQAQIENESVQNKPEKKDEEILRPKQTKQEQTKNNEKTDNIPHQSDHEEVKENNPSAPKSEDQEDKDDDNADGEDSRPSNTNQRPQQETPSEKEPDSEVQDIEEQTSEEPILEEPTNTEHNQDEDEEPEQQDVQEKEQEQEPHSQTTIEEEPKLRR